jgi:hypothetical protein
VIKQLIEMLDAFRRLPSSVRAAVFAHAIVPILAVGAAAYIGSGKGPLLTASGSVTVIQLTTDLDGSGNASAKNGVGVIVQPEDSETTLIMDADIRSIRSSLSLDEALANYSKIEIRKKSIVLRAPFRYVETPALFILEGKAPPNAGTPGGSTEISEFSLPARHSPGIVVTLMLIVSFTIGLAFTIPGGGVFFQIVEAAASSAAEQ